jgi:RHS repeat-associated protein
VHAVVDAATGQVMQTIDYTPLGDVASDSRPGFQPFGFAGGLLDPDTRLVHFGAREYDARWGRWLTSDPGLFKGKDENVYEYALSDPVNSHDDTGETSLIELQETVAVRDILMEAGKEAISGCLGSWGVEYNREQKRYETKWLDCSWENFVIEGATGAINKSLGIGESAIGNVSKYGVGCFFNAVQGTLNKTREQLLEDNGHVELAPLTTGAVNGCTTAVMGELANDFLGGHETVHVKQFGRREGWQGQVGNFILATFLKSLSTQWLNLLEAGVEAENCNREPGSEDACFEKP